jgi:hypothetical protein
MNGGLTTVYTVLRDLCLCKSTEHFSTRWLGMEKSYWRGLRSNGRAASAQAVLNCAKNLRVFAEVCQKSLHPAVHALYPRLQQLSDECIQELLNPVMRSSGSLGKCRPPLAFWALPQR